MPSESEYRIEHVEQAPSGYRVRTIPSGQHWIRLAFPPGPRRRGSGRLIEILHPRGENPCKLNPAELVILGNPSSRFSGWEHFTNYEKNFLSRQLGLPAPKNMEEVQAYKATLRKIDELNERYRARGNPWIGAGNFSTKQAAEARKRDLEAAGHTRIQIVRSATGTAAENYAVVYFRRGNPAEASETQQAVKLYQDFHGKDPQGVIEAQRSAAMRTDYTCLGALLGLGPYVEGERIPSPEHWDSGGYPVLLLEPAGIKLASNAEGTQLYSIGGDQDLSEVLGNFDVDATKDLVDLGELAFVVYKARKSMDGFQEVDYMHAFDEPRPRIGYDQVKREIFFVGGRYVVRAPGIEH